MRQIYTFKCSTCKRLFIEMCKCKFQKAKKVKERTTKSIELNLDRHCGVFSPSTNTYCLRSLKCKSHSVHLKRAVKGRSKPFDILLSEMKINAAATDIPIKTEDSEFISTTQEWEEILELDQKMSFPLNNAVLKHSLTCRRPVNI